MSEWRFQKRGHSQEAVPFYLGRRERVGLQNAIGPFGKRRIPGRARLVVTKM
jgi:hypothetical protein